MNTVTAATIPAALTKMQRALVACLVDGSVVVESGGVVRTDDMWTDRTIASLVRKGYLVRAERLDVGNRRAYRLVKRFVSAV